MGLNLLGVSGICLLIILIVVLLYIYIYPDRPVVIGFVVGSISSLVFLYLIRDMVAVTTLTEVQWFQILMLISYLLPVILVSWSVYSQWTWGTLYCSM